MIKIIVESEKIKEELIKESEYLHNLNLDTDNFNTLAHLYLLPDDGWIIDDSQKKSYIRVV